MPFNGSGVFQRLYNWTNDRNNGIKIRADRMDAETDGIATGLSNCITKDGQTTITQNIPFNDKRITGLGDATADTDALNRRSADARYVELTDLGTGVAAFLTTPSSANLAAAVTGETGTGALVFATSPALAGTPTTPTASASTQNTQIASTAFVWGTLGAPSGTELICVNNTAPLGWVKNVSGWNHALRLTGGTLGVGGSTAFTTVFASRTIEEANLPAHTHGVGTLATASAGAHQHNTVTSAITTSAIAVGDSIARERNATADVDYRLTGSVATPDRGLTSSDGAHTHSITGATAATGGAAAMDFAVQYVDVCIISRS